MEYRAKSFHNVLVVVYSGYIEDWHRCIKFVPRDVVRAVAAPVFMSSSESSPAPAHAPVPNKGSAGSAAGEIENTIGRQKPSTFR